jgi:hypothetical protein
VLVKSDTEGFRIVAYLDTQGQRINLTNNVVPVSPNIKVYQSCTMLKTPQLLSVVVGLILVFRHVVASHGTSPLLTPIAATGLELLDYI